MAYIEGRPTFTAGAAVEAKRRVKLSSGTTASPPEVEHAGLDEDYIGFTEFAAGAGDLVTVRLKNEGGLFDVVCAVDTAIAVGTELYPAASGALTDAVGVADPQAVAMQAGSDGQIIKVMPI